MVQHTSGAREAAQEIVRDQGIWHLFDRASDPVMAHDRLIEHLTTIISKHFPDAVPVEQPEGELPIEDLERDHYRDHPPDVE